MTREEAIKEAYGIPVTKAQHEALQILIPELAESEDESIRKEIVDFLRFTLIERGIKNGKEKAEKWIAYLEKQKDQMLERINIAEMVAKYRVTDEYIEGEYKGKPVNCMIRAYEQGIRDTLLKVKEQKPTECLKPEKNCWYVCIKDFYAGGKKQSSNGDLVQAKGGMYIMGRDDISEWFRKAYYDEIKPAEWSDEDEAMLKEIISFFKDGSVKLQHDLDLYAGFLEKRLKSLRPQPNKWHIKKGHWYMCIVDKPEYGWTKGKVYQSPEDNRIETNYKGSLTNWPDSEPWFRPATRSEIPDSHLSWKPSDEQMKALKIAVDKLIMQYPGRKIALQTLYNDLQKQM